MPSLGFPEIVLIGIVMLLVVGPERLPQATRTLGQIYARVRREADNFRRTLVLEADRLDEEERLKELRRKRLEAQAEKDRQAAEGAPPDDGTRAQPEPVDTPVDPAAHDLAAPAPGFTEEEWNELPAHIREIVKRRRVT